MIEELYCAPSDVWMELSRHLGGEARAWEALPLLPPIWELWEEVEDLFHQEEFEEPPAFPEDYAHGEGDYLFEVVFAHLCEVGLL